MNDGFAEEFIFIRLAGRAFGCFELQAFCGRFETEFVIVEVIALAEIEKNLEGVAVECPYRKGKGFFGRYRVGHCGRREAEQRKTEKQETGRRSEEHTSELQSRPHLVCR